MESDNKRKKKYRLRKGRVAAAAGILTAVAAAAAVICVIFVNKGNNGNNGGNSPTGEHTVNPDEIVDKDEYVSIDLEDCNLYVGNILRLKCSSRPEEYSRKVIWSSSDMNIVSVNGKGDIVVKAEGTAAITATCGVLSDSVIIKAVRRESQEYDKDFPVYDVSEGQVVAVQTAAPNDSHSPVRETEPVGEQDTGFQVQPAESDGSAENPAESDGSAENPTTLPEETGNTGQEHPADAPTAASEGEEQTSSVQPATEAPGEGPRDILTAGINAAGFTKYLDDTFIYSEAGVYLGEIIVGDSFSQIYVMTRTTSFDAAIKNVIMTLLPGVYENVFAQLISAESDRTFNADGYKVRIVAPAGGGHAQLIIYY